MNKPTHVEMLSEPIAVSMADSWFSVNNEDHFWMQWRFGAFQKYFGHVLENAEAILEVGCGNGIFRDQLEREGCRVDACDLNLYALQKAKKGKGRLMLYNIYDLNEELKGKYDLIFLMDVIEHIDDDADFLRMVKKHLKPGGNIVLNVPAGMWLYSQYDKEDGHKRRYNRKMLQEALDKSGFACSGMHYWACSMVPLVLVRKWYLNFVEEGKAVEKGFKPPGALVHGILKGVKNVELAMPFPSFTGTSLMAVAKAK